MVDPGVNVADPRVVDYDDDVGAVSGYVLYKLVAEGVSQRETVEAFGCISVDENDRSVGVSVYERVYRFEVPESKVRIRADSVSQFDIPTDSATISDNTILNRFERTNHVGRRARARTTCIWSANRNTYSREVISVPAVIRVPFKIFQPQFSSYPPPKRAGLFQGVALTSASYP